ncbi:MAG: CDGSH iron-sulfur domain-containing protein [Burkholderiaceae bacterium]
MSDETYAGKSVTITIHAGRCIHSRNCVLGLPDVWVAGAKGGWVHPDAASAEAVAAVAQRCPSGAITYQRHDGGLDEQAPAVNTIRVLENGPLAVHADIRIDGQALGYRATLCRCGASRRKPFCDNSHLAAAFQASGEPLSTESSALARRDGPLAITPKPNGPLRVEGPVEICSGTGRCVTRGEQMVLCRCGGSANKPFCDGSHKRNGFSAA